MGFRFRRSIRLAPGVRLNLSKSGVSTTIGVPGANVNVGRAPRATLGIPGTGLSYQTSLRKVRYRQGGQSSVPGGERHTATAVSVPGISDDSLLPFDPHGERVVLQRQVAAQVRRELGSGNGAIFALGLLAAGLPFALGWGLIAAEVGLGGVGLALSVASPVAGMAAAIWQMRQHAARLESLVALRLEEVWPAELERAQDDHAAAVALWEALAEPSGPTGVVAEAVEAVLDDVSWPFDVTCQVSVPTRERVFLLVDLPEIEDITHEGAKLKDRQAVYARNVCSIAIMVATCAFAAARCVRKVTVAAYTQRRARDGTLRDDFVLELPAHRSALKALTGSEDPVAFVTSANGGRIKITKTMKLSRIPAPKWAPEL